MADNYVKVFGSILDSSIWQEDSDTKVVWITLLAMADQHGEVHSSIPGLAHRAGVSLEACEKALELFMSPDRYSSTPDNEGRRIAPINRGWEILNYKMYRELHSQEEQRERHRTRQQRYRERQRAVTPNVTLRDARDVTRDARDPIGEGKGEGEVKEKPSSSELCSDGGSSPAKQKRQPCHEAGKLSQLLADEIRRNKPDYRITPKQQRDWATTADRMIRLDNRDPEKIGALICWAQRDEFWIPNMLSMGTLRKKYDQLEMKREKETKRGSNTNHVAPPTVVSSGRTALDNHFDLLREAGVPAEQLLARGKANEGAQ